MLAVVLIKLIIVKRARKEDGVGDHVHVQSAWSVHTLPHCILPCDRNQGREELQVSHLQ